MATSLMLVEFNPVGFIVSTVGIAIVMAIFRSIMRRRDQAGYQAAAEEFQQSGAAAVAASDALPSMAFKVAPASPFHEGIARIREVLGDASALPRITRYTRPIVIVTERSLTITEKSGGTFLAIPAADIVTVRAEPGLIKAKGVILARIFPSVHVTVRRGDAQEVLSLAPITGMYDKVTKAQAEELAGEIAYRLGVILGEPVR